MWKSISANTSPPVRNQWSACPSLHSFTTPSWLATKPSVLPANLEKQLAQLRAVLRAAVREDLVAAAAREADGAVREQLVQQLVEANNIAAPPSLVDRMLHGLLHAYGVPHEKAEGFYTEFRPVAVGVDPADGPAVGPARRSSWRPGASVRCGSCIGPTFCGRLCPILCVACHPSTLALISTNSNAAVVPVNSRYLVTSFFNG